MKKESISTIEGCPVNFLRLREHHASHPKWDPFMSSTAFLSSRLDLASNLYRRDLFAHYGCVNAIEFSQEGCLLISGGDDRRVLLWNLEESISGKFQPVPMKEEHSSNIFCLGFDSKNTKIYSAGNDEQVIVHDVGTGETLNAFMHEEAIYGVSVNPYIDSIFASAGEDGQVLLFDTRSPRTEEPLLLARSYDPFHAVQFHPVEPKFVVTANPKEGVVLWDVRKPRIPFLKYGDRKSPESSMCARFNSCGTQIIALRRRLPPILFSTHTAAPVCQFDADHYYNSCTMKSCCFAGSRDQYVLSGSDDFNLYMWRIPDIGSQTRFVSEAHLVLKGHRSIVNQVRFNPRNFTIASSGVEKIIKLWSTVPVPGSNGTLESRGRSHSMTRRVYTHEEYIGLVLDSGQNVSHDYSHGNTAEDPRMMAFFDSLVQREVEGWTTNTDFSDDDLDTNSTPTYSSSTVPSTDDSDSDGDPWSQPRTTAGSSSSSSLPLRRRRIFRTRKLRRIKQNRSSVAVPDNLNESSDGEKSSAPARPAPGSDWILRLIAKKRAQLKAAKKKRKHSKKKQKNKSRKFIRCLTSSSSRPRPYLYRPDNYRSVAMTRSSTSLGGQLLQRRHVVAPYTVMALGSYADSEEEEDSDLSLSDNASKGINNISKSTKKSTENEASESSAGKNQSTSKCSSSTRKNVNQLQSSESSSSSNENSNKKILLNGRKRKLPIDNRSTVKKANKLSELVPKSLRSEFNDSDLRNGANNVSKNSQVKGYLSSDIDVSEISNVSIGISDNSCCSRIDLSENQKQFDTPNVNDVISINGISMDKSGSVLFELNQPQCSQSSTLDIFDHMDRQSSKNVPDANASNDGFLSPRSSHSDKYSLHKFYSNGLLDDNQGLFFDNINNVNEHNLHDFEECQSTSTQNFAALQPDNCSLVTHSNYSGIAKINSSPTIEEDSRYLVTPERNNIANSLNGVHSHSPDSVMCSSLEHTPQTSVTLSDAQTPDSGIASISLIANCESLSSNCINLSAVTSDERSTKHIDSNSVKNVSKSCEISFKKIPDYKIRNYRSRSSGDDIM